MERPNSSRLPSFLAVDRSLGITGAWDVFHKLKWEFAEFRELSEINYSLEPEDRIPMRRPMYAAINTASTAWALVEWVWREAQADPGVQQRLAAKVGEKATQTPRDLKAWARTIDDLEACHQIAHQAKHGDLREPNPRFNTSVSLWYPRSPDGREGWRQIGRVVWRTEEGGERETSINNLFASVLQFWDRTLDELQIVERMIVIATE